MNDHCLTVEAIHRSKIDDGASNYESLWGGIDPAPTWQEYLDDFDDNLIPYLLVARDWLTKTYGDDPPLACDWCNDWALQFSDGFVLSFTWRAWGDFVQSVRDRKEGYMAFYS